MPKQVAEPAPEEKKAPECDEVGVHDPGKRLFREPEIGPDRREGDADDGHVEDDHQVTQAEDEEREPPPVGEINPTGGRRNLGVSVRPHRSQPPWAGSLPG